MNRTEFKILFHDRDVVAIDKPPGFHVHQPEFPRRRVPNELTCLSNLRDQIRAYLYPVHRIDVATEGVLIFALNKEAASKLCRQFQESVVEKTYFAIVRGYTPDAGTIDVPLQLDSTGELAASVTHYKTWERVELPFSAGKRHSTVRYSLVEAHPETGRFHQVRRHMARISHPLIGDAAHGDSHQNRFFRTQFESPGLWLKAKSIQFMHPTSGEMVRIESAWAERWRDIFGKVGFNEPGGVI